MSDPFATVPQIIEQWGPLDSVQQARATALLDMAAIILRRHVDFSGLAAGDEKLRIAKQVSIDMVIDALTPDGRRGMSSHSSTVGGITESVTLLNPAATLTFTETQRLLFGLTRAAEPQWHFGEEPLP